MTTQNRFQIENELREAAKERRDAEIAKRLRNHRIQVDRHKRAKRFRETQHRLDFLAIGDSWFDYPDPLDVSIVAQLQSMGSPPPVILSYAWPGQASTEVLTYENQQCIINALEDGAAWINGKGPDAILVSMGGDDIAGDQFAIYIEYGGVKGLSDRFQGVLDLVSASYADLFALRDKFAPGVPIFSHCYDYALPNGWPAIPLLLGPWLKPSFDFALYTDGTWVVREMIDKYYDTLNGLGGTKFYLVNTRNTIAPNNTYPGGWANELHPYPPGFAALANKFLAALRSYFSAGSI
jgi:hypothetical protein